MTIRAITITNVMDDGYAAKSGMRPNDIIFSINGIKISDPQQVNDELAKGTSHLTVIRDSEFVHFDIDSKTLGVTLGKCEFDEQKFEEIQLIAGVKLSTAPIIPGKNIVRHVDIVGAQCVYGVTVLADLAAGIRDIVGGRSVGLQNRIAQARKEISYELKLAAYKLGANGVVSIHFEHAEIGDKGGFMLMVTATGTAVVCE